MQSKNGFLVDDHGPFPLSKNEQLNKPTHQTQANPSSLSLTVLAWALLAALGEAVETSATSLVESPTLPPSVVAQACRKHGHGDQEERP
jgi:hypothetical protein